MLELEDSGVVHKIYQVNICSTYRMNINMCSFFFNYKTNEGDYRFWITKAFPLHWKKQLSKKLIDYLLTLEYYYWFSCNFDRIEDKILKERISDYFLLYPPININIREYNV